MNVKVGQRYRAPEDCACGKCNKLDSIIISIDEDDTIEGIRLECCSCGNIESVGEEDMFNDFLDEEESYTLIKTPTLVKERVSAPFESK